MRVMQWLPVLLVLVACGSAAGTGSGESGGDGASAPEAAAIESGSADSTTDSATDAVANDAASPTDATSSMDVIADTGATDGTASDGLSDAGGSIADAPPDSPACTTGQTGCAGMTPETCSGGQWILADAACSGTTPTCSAGVCVPCSPGATQCNGNGTQTCGSNGTWSAPVDCTPTSQTCVGGVCVGACSPSQTQCSGNDVQTCNSSGQWASTTSCTALDQTCIGGACVGMCVSGKPVCNGNAVETCDPTGNYGTPVSCNNETCVDGQCGLLTIAPANQAILVSYGQASPTVQYTATINGVPVPAAFAIAGGQIGTIASATGLMTPTGTIGGVTTVTATFQNQTVTANLTVTILLVQNGDPGAGVDAGGAGGNGGVGGSGPGGVVGPGTVSVLNGSPVPDGASWLYPYNQTMWPQGLLAPLLQWQPGTGGPYSAVYVQMNEVGFSYQGYFAANAAPFINLPIEQQAWDTMTYSSTGGPVTVALIFAANGVAYGPITETWQIAAGTLQGTVYYNSYGTNLVKNYCCTLGNADFGGATLAIKHGATSPVLVAGTATMNSGCRVCHSVSADGSTLVTEHGDNYFTSSWYALSNYGETQMNPTGTGQFAWPALFPNGSMLLANGAPLAGTNGVAAQLYDTQTGAVQASTGLPSGLKAGSPVFSPDGKHVAFNYYGGTVNSVAADGVSLAAMDYNATTSTFSNFRVLYKPPSGTSVYPTFMPTNSAVVFELQVQYNGRDWGGTRSPCDSTACANESLAGAQGELWWVDLATSTATQLSSLNGVGYLPSSASHVNDAVLNFEPTIGPVPSAGEAWVVFTSRRLYGNVATLPPYYSDPRYVDLTTEPTPKKLWVAAIDVNGTAGTDPSHPAFYLPGQEILAGNSRGYWVVDPCQANGTSCQSGDECCGGYCEATEGGLECSSQPPSCSQIYDKCTTTADCCGSATLSIGCINGVCSQSTASH